MTEGRPTDGATAVVQGVGKRLAGQADDFANRLAGYLFREMPELGSDPQFRVEVTDAAGASLRGWLGMVRRGSPAESVVPPPDVLALARTWVLRGAPLPILIRAFHVGHGFVVREVAAGLSEAERAPELLGELMERLLALSFAYVDALTAHVVDVYTGERARMLRGADAARAEAARRIISGEPIDVDAASRELGYELRRWHIGIVVWSDATEAGDDPLSRLEKTAAEIAATLGGGRPLLVPAGHSLLWAWTATPGPPDAETRAGLRARRLDDEINASCGEPGEGATGFARSHTEALEARRVALVSGRRGGITAYTDVELISLLAADHDRARRFMHDELGALGSDDEATARLRTTLRIYLEEGRSYVGAARRIGSHENTVKYRVRRCEELLGARVSEEPLKRSRDEPQRSHSHRQALIHVPRPGDGRRQCRLPLDARHLHQRPRSALLGVRFERGLAEERNHHEHRR